MDRWLQATLDYIPRWLDRALPNLTIEAPHDGHQLRPFEEGEPAVAKVVGQRPERLGTQGHRGREHPALVQESRERVRHQ